MGTKFQRTRGVLRLLAAVIHSLWEKGDRNPIILPSSLPIGEPRVEWELTRYLPDNWAPVIEKDVDGPGALPLRLDGEVPNLGKYSAGRRVARTVYLGSAPISTAANRGLEDRRIKLGCVMPGESPQVFGDALRRLAAAATYLYQDGPRYWYSTQPTVTKLAEDRAEQLRREPEKAHTEIAARLRADLREQGDFSRIHLLPSGSQDVPDDLDARLVVLGPEEAYSKEPGSAAERTARQILEARGSAPRQFQNSLVFLAADQSRLQDLEEAARRFLAWQSILADRETLNLDPHQVRQAENQKRAAEGALDSRLPETYQWLLVAVQDDPRASASWQAARLTGQEALAARASRKLRNDELLLSTLAGTRLRMALDAIPLWRGEHVSLRQLVEDFARYLYLPRLREPSVLLAAVRDGVGLLTWERESFAWADGWDEASGRYRGLRAGQNLVALDVSSPGLLVRPEAARRQLTADEEMSAASAGAPAAGPALNSSSAASPSAAPEAQPASPPAPPPPRRFHGTVQLDPTRVGRDASRIADEVISHLAGQLGAEVTVTLEIETLLPEGASEALVRTVSENSRTLGFDSQGFERE